MRKSAILFPAVLFSTAFGVAGGRSAVPAPLPGYLVHFNSLENAQEGEDVVAVAKQAGAKVINVVPPPHVWERPDAMALLDDLVQYIGASHLKLIFTRMDASYPPDREGNRQTYPFSDRGKWAEDETRFYAKRFGSLKYLAGFSLEVSTGQYEACRRIWHEESQRADVPFILAFDGSQEVSLSTADAIGLSFGPSLIQTNTGQLKEIHDSGKDVFILEAGCEDLRFCASVAKSLASKTFIYAYLKEPFDLKDEKNPGWIVDREGNVRRNAYKSTKKVMADFLNKRSP